MRIKCTQNPVPILGMRRLIIHNQHQLLINSSPANTRCSSPVCKKASWMDESARKCELDPSKQASPIPCCYSYLLVTSRAVRLSRE
jgi:hypothetical protein